ncbi:MAG: GWxTD domain-containing protein [Balneolaceae bacterium]|nr:MAG: GWxTD domain-containing protein [Balneolaceae bacterium]
MGYFPLLISLAISLQYVLQADVILDAEYWLERGRLAEAAGEYEHALQIWSKAQSELRTPSTELGLEYIRLASEQQLREYYPMAVAMYNWGLSDQEISGPNIDALAAELARLEPLAGQEEFRRWTGLLEDRNPLLLDELRGFWQLMNPVPGRNYNPRLLEHWERIAYARKHFTRAVEPPYGTDVRGRYYVKYGEPDRKEEGMFSLNESDVSRAIRNAEISSRAVIDILQRRAHTPHRYEYWIYDSPNEDMMFNLVLLFGERSAGGFDRLYTLEDLFPNSLFTSNRQNFGLAAITVLEIYYRQLANRDPYFMSMYHEVMSRKRSDLSPSLASQMVRFQNQVTTRRNLSPAPEQISAEEKGIPSIPLQVYQYRLIDDEGNPFLLSFLESRITTAFVLDQREENGSVNGQELLNRYELMHGLRVSDLHRRTIGLSRNHPDLIIDPFEDSPSSSIFTVPFVSAGTTQLFFAELTNINPGSSRNFESLLPDDLRGLGRLELPQPEHLERDGRLLMGDLILGYGKMPEAVEGVLFDFVVANDRRIPVDENLVVHFELYDLQQDGEGIANFEIEYEIIPVSRFLFWERFGDHDDFSLTLSFSIDRPRFAESLEIETPGLEPGRYELIWRVRDLNSGYEVQQELRLEIIE